MTNGSNKAAIAFLIGVAATITLIVIGDYLGVIDLIDTSEPPLPLFIAVVMCVTMIFVLRKAGQKSDD